METLEGLTDVVRFILRELLRKVQREDTQDDYTLAE